jgi:pyrroline-5-carboxylate reductase
MKVAIVGGGVMGGAILAAGLEKGALDRATTVVCEKLADRREALAAAHGVTVTADAREAVEGADAVLISVKPQEFTTATAPLKTDAVLISIMAGIRIASLRQEFSHPRIVRAMPNTPAAIAAGMTAWTATAEVAPEQRAFARTLFAASGSELYVDDEKKIDMATAVSGSGPAYVYLMMEAMIEGGVLIGLTRAQSEQLVLETVLGSALYARESGRPASELRAMVTSPGGTTAAGLLELEKGGMRATFMECVRAAHRRAVELGEPH